MNLNGRTNRVFPPYLEYVMDVYLKAFTVRSGEHFTTVNELTDQIPATRPEVLLAAMECLIKLGLPGSATKVLSEEDKGAVLAGLFSVRMGLPLAMARLYTYDIGSPMSTYVPIRMEYFRGSLLVNGITHGDKVLIIDDTLATGGTIVSLAKAVRQMRAEVVDVRVLVEKLGSGGRERIRTELGLEIKAAIGIRLHPDNSVTIEEVMEHPIGGVEADV